MRANFELYLYIYINSGGSHGFQCSQIWLCYSDIEMGNFLVVEMCKLDQILE